MTLGSVYGNEVSRALYRWGFVGYHVNGLKLNDWFGICEMRPCEHVVMKLYITLVPTPRRWLENMLLSSML